MSVFAAPDRDTPERRAPGRLLAAVWRYGLSSFGPVVISGAHLFASVLFLRALSRAEFGLLSFLFVFVPFCLSISGALVGASVTRVAARSKGLPVAELATHAKANWVLSAAAGACVTVFVCIDLRDNSVAALLGLYAVLMTLRWFGRNVAYALKSPLRAAASDMAYAGTLLLGLAILNFAHRLDASRAGTVLVAAAAAGVAALGGDFLRHRMYPSARGSLLAFCGVWHNLAKWSVLGVILTELTANAHVYLVTFVFGPASFALLAVGSLLTRPVMLVLAALPDLERPEMARRLAAGDRIGALRSVKEFRTAAGAVWFATFLLAGAVLMWFPHLVLKHGYEGGPLLVVLVLWGAITAVRVVRTPESVLLQAAGKFRSLAAASGWSSAASLMATLLLMLSLGPIASLGGVLIGEIVMTARIFSLSRHWKLDHG